jgi:ligand-binding sensor domain-containing protein
LSRLPRSVSAALVAIVALAGLLAAGRWLQPRLDQQTPAAAPTRPPPSTSPPVVTATNPPGSPGIAKTAATALVDAIAVTPRGVWVAAGGLVLRIDPVTRRKVVVPGIETVAPPVVELAAGAGTVWAATTAGRPLLRIDPRTARVAASLSVPARAVVADRSGVWAVCCEAGARRGQLIRIDPVSGRVVKVIGLPGHAYAVGIGPSGVWVRGAGQLWRIDPTSYRVVATIPLPSSNAGTGQPGGDIAVTEDSVWVSDPAAATVWRIDARHNQVDGTAWEADGSDLAVAADGVVWASSDTRLLGLGGSEVRGPRRNLHELNTDRITAVAAARDGGLWLGTAQGLFHVDQSVLREDDNGRP